MSDRERRTLPPTEVRLSGTKKGIRGLGIPTNVEADIGGFTESITPAAVREIVDEGGVTP